MDWFFLIYDIYFTGYSFYAWKKYSDQEFFWLAILGVFVVLLLAAKLFLISLLPENIKVILSVLVYCSWALVLAALVLIVKKRK